MTRKKRRWNWKTPIIAGVAGLILGTGLGYHLGNKEPAPKARSAPQGETSRATTLESLLEKEAERLDIDRAVLDAVLEVETNGKPYGSDGKLLIRFEPHKFNKYSGTELGSWKDKGKPHYNKRKDRRIDNIICEGGQDHEYDCLKEAASIDSEAAYKSISMGLAQIMGFHYKKLGYKTAKGMYQAFQKSEVNQVKGFFRFLESEKGLLKAARNKDFDTFARLYNGKKNAKAYGSRLEKAYKSRTPNSLTDRIAEEARNDVGKKSYSKRANRSGFHKGDPKCNLYVHDLLERVGIDAPTYPDSDGDGHAWPYVAAEWANPKKKIPGWKVVKKPKPGDVCAVKFKAKNATGHVGIVVGKRHAVSARSQAISKDGFCLTDKYKGRCTYRKYVGN
jgi:hypothetical protein